MDPHSDPHSEPIEEYINPFDLVLIAKVLKEHLEPPDSLSLASTNRFANSSKYSFIKSLCIQERDIHHLTFPEMVMFKEIRIVENQEHILTRALKSIWNAVASPNKPSLPSRPRFDKLIIPSGIESITFTYYIDLTRFTFPSTVTSIHFKTKSDPIHTDPYHKSINNPETNHLQLHLLPLHITTLTLDLRFNQKVDNFAELFPNLTNLTFGHCFNQSVSNLPKSLTHLTFGLHFNQPVDHLPLNLQSLIFGIGFNQNVDHLPSNLTKLVLNGFFNKPLNHLPSTLEILILKMDCSPPELANHLPSLPNLTHLHLPNNFNDPILISSCKLEYLHIGDYFNQEISNLLPLNQNPILWNQIRQTNHHSPSLVRKSNLQRRFLQLLG